MVLFVIASIFLIAGGGLLMVSLDLHSSAALIYGLSSLVAVETGLSLVTGYTIANLTLKPEDVSLGLVLQNVSHIGGQVIALAITD
ncbi:hypothetical protein CFE70_007354 [Pyrenophora teres f. teres 0-1]